MGGKADKDETHCKEKKRSLFKSLFSGATSKSHTQTASPSAHSGKEAKVDHRPTFGVAPGAGPRHSARPPQIAQPADGPRRSSFQVSRDSQRPPASVRRDSAMPPLAPAKSAPADMISQRQNPSNKATGSPPKNRIPGKDLSLAKPVLHVEAEEGVTVQLYFDEYRTNAASYPSSPSSPNPGNRALPVLRINQTAASLSGVLRISNKSKPYVSPRLAVMLFTGQGRTGIPVNDPEAPSAAGLHSRPIARSATYIWKEPVLVETGTHDFPFTIPLSTGIPPSLNTFSSIHSNRLDVWHSVFVKMRRNDLDHIISRQDLVIQKCPPESPKINNRGRNKTATGAIANDLIMFRAEGADMCDIDAPATQVIFHVYRNNIVGNCVLIDSVECQWKERITLREGRGGAITRLERALHTPIRKIMSMDAADTPLSFGPQFNVPIQPDGEFDSVKITHEVVFTVEYFSTPLADSVTKELVVVPVKFVASTAAATLPEVVSSTDNPSPDTPRNPASQRTSGTSSLRTDVLPLPIVEQAPERRVSQASTHSAGKQYRSEHDFFPSEPDEVQLAVGDIVVIWQSFDDGWATGQNLRTSAQGFFPLNALGEQAWSRSEAAAAGLVAPAQSDGQFLTCQRKASRLPTAAPEQVAARASAHQEASNRRKGVDSGFSGLLPGSPSEPGEASQVLVPAPSSHDSVRGGSAAGSGGESSRPPSRAFIPTQLAYGYDATIGLPTPRFEYNSPDYAPASPHSASEPHSSQHSNSQPSWQSISAGEPMTPAYDVSPMSSQLPSPQSPPIYQSTVDPTLPSNPAVSEAPNGLLYGQPPAQPFWDPSAQFFPPAPAPSHRHTVYVPSNGYGGAAGFFDQGPVSASNAAEPQTAAGFPPAANDRRPSRHSVQVGPPIHLRAYRAIQEFRPQDRGEMELRLGDLVSVEESLASGWSLGTNLISGERGYFPSTSVVPQQQTTAQLRPAPQYDYTQQQPTYQPLRDTKSPIPTDGQSGPSRTPSAGGFGPAPAAPTTTTFKTTMEKLSPHSVQLLLKRLDEELVEGLVDPQEYLRRREYLAQRSGVAVI
ncbi:hypothetical protein PhCBS80983_g03744 [Powellomyces hirtus]|uniref:SH3 domain-containing protein n=1 Tax=Powellomyces hirtus TaxID=109895 RepID=A0A507E0H1_9FUNG|nr:hypothetical protein PhCBS80983_g03744 [Powellomyces hirtus]